MRPVVPAKAATRLKEVDAKIHTVGDMTPVIDDVAHRDAHKTCIQLRPCLP